MELKWPGIFVVVVVAGLASYQVMHGFKQQKAGDADVKAVPVSVTVTRDHFPAGYVSLAGEFFATHEQEILHLIQHREVQEKAEHPLQRIMAIEKTEHGTVVTTTDIHLARGIGEALHHAYQGELEFHHNPEQNLLRVNWSR
jgi:hypothetical protein